MNRNHTIISTDAKEKKLAGDIPGCPVVKNPSCNAGDAGSIPGWGTKIPRAMGQLSPPPQLQSPRALEPTHHNYRARALWSPHATTRELTCRNY